MHAWVRGIATGGMEREPESGAATVRDVARVARHALRPRSRMPPYSAVQLLLFPWGGEGGGGTLGWK